MKKKTIFSLIILSCLIHFLNAQNSTLAEPTTGSLSNYVNTAISHATGVPNITIPIYQLESSNKEFPVNLSLSYHVYNAKPNVPASEVGQGWSIFASGLITREVMGTIDESIQWTDITEDHADVFYYNIPGHSGKFKIYRDTITGNSVLNNMSGEKIKIEFNRDISNTKLIINSFKIIDDKGFQYYFDDYNIGLEKTVTYYNYKTSFFLTKVKDQNGNEIVNYNYDKKVQYMGISSTKKYQYCKINTISTSKGKIKFDFYFNALSDNSEMDPYRLNSISLTDIAGRIQSKYQFDYGGATLSVEVPDANEMIESTVSRPVISRIEKLDKNLTKFEETLFEYDSMGSATQYGFYNDMRYGNYLCNNKHTLSPKKYSMGMLHKITFPTKGSVVYNFEANTIYQDNVLSHSQDWDTHYYEMTEETTFDTNITNNYNLPITTDSYFEIGVSEYYFNTDIHGNPIPFSYQLKRSGNTLLTPVACNSNTLYKVFPATYQLTTRGGAKGFIRRYTLKKMPLPLKNERVQNIGARIKSIESLDAEGNLLKTKNYEYNSFINALDSSGEPFFGTNSISFDNGFVLYKNVKETEIAGSNNNGYIKYYYKTPNDYLLPPNNYYFPYYNLTSGGILEKKEIYNSLNELTESNEYEYNFQEIPNVPETSANNGTTKPSWLQYTKETAKTYVNNGVYQKIEEKTFSPDNFQEIITKSTTPEGDTSEVFTRYALELNNNRLLTNNMISVPLEVESKSNGVMISKTTTKYDNAAHFYPTSIEMSDLAQVNETQATFDIYDDKGNLVQSTDKTGNSVTTIWGYHKTLPIAQIIGAKYNDVISLPSVIAAITASDADADNPINESALLTALENMRLDTALQQYTMSVSTFDPLIGITNSVSANGIKQSYEYNASGKLFRVKNANGQVIKENQYNYKH